MKGSGTREALAAGQENNHQINPGEKKEGTCPVCGQTHTQRVPKEKSVVEVQVNLPSLRTDTQVQTKIV
jgi:hypothetical protein